MLERRAPPLACGKIARARGTLRAHRARCAVTVLTLVAKQSLTGPREWQSRPERALLRLVERRLYQHTVWAPPMARTIPRTESSQDLPGRQKLLGCRQPSSDDSVVGTEDPAMMLIQTMKNIPTKKTSMEKNTKTRTMMPAARVAHRGPLLRREGVHIQLRAEPVVGAVA